MVNNPALWFVGGLIVAVVVNTIWKCFTRFLSYESDIAKLNLRITDVKCELDKFIRDVEDRRSFHYSLFNERIDKLSYRIAALEPKKTK